jgi:hypothetical protein
MAPTRGCVNSEKRKVPARYCHLPLLTMPTGRNAKGHSERAMAERKGTRRVLTDSEWYAAIAKRSTSLDRGLRSKRAPPMRGIVEFLNRADPVALYAQQPAHWRSSSLA